MARVYHRVGCYVSLGWTANRLQEVVTSLRAILTYYSVLYSRRLGPDKLDGAAPERVVQRELEPDLREEGRRVVAGRAPHVRLEGSSYVHPSKTTADDVHHSQMIM